MTSHLLRGQHLLWPSDLGANTISTPPVWEVLRPQPRLWQPCTATGASGWGLQKAPPALGARLRMKRPGRNVHYSFPRSPLAWHLAQERGVQCDAAGVDWTLHPATPCLSVFSTCGMPLILSTPVCRSELLLISLPHRPKVTTGIAMSGTAFGPAVIPSCFPA